MSGDTEKKLRDEQAPVLGKDEAAPNRPAGADQAPQPDEDEEEPMAIDLPLEENQFNSQPG